MDPSKIERRWVQCTFRADMEGEGRVLRGHAAVFDQTTDLGWFKERIARQAFDEVLDGDVRALFNHDPNLILGRTKSRTLRLSVDEAGLGYEVDTAETSYGTDLLVSVRRGDVSQSSFAFSIAEESWDYETNTRTILRFAELFDVSPVTYPAYTETDVSARSSRDLEEIYQSAQRERQARIQRLLRRARMARVLKGESL